MPLASSLEQLPANLNPTEQANLQQGKVVLTGTDGTYTVLALVSATAKTVWQVLTAYEKFPDFLPSVVASRVLEKRGNRILLERKDRRKIGWLPIKVKMVTENIERFPERIDYHMVDGTLDTMHGYWHLVSVDEKVTLLTQYITAQANLGPLQPYFFEVFERGLVETMGDLRRAMESQKPVTSLSR